MHPLENHIIQLQELTLIREEQKVAAGRAHLEQLDASIKEMTEKLPEAIKYRFTRLHKKDPVAIVPISAELCAACGMKLPISLIQAVRLGRDIHACPNCARMLYFPESAPRWVGKRPTRAEPAKEGIARFSSHTLMIPKLESEDKEGIIRELAYKMENEGFVDKAEKLVQMALEREAIISTAVDNGLAFPHVRGVEGGGLTLAMGLTSKPLSLNSLDKNQTRIVFFLVIPTAASAFYLKLLSGLTEAFMKPEARKAVLAEKEPEKLWKALVKITRATIK
ncbi:MAG: hypothetical protein C0404_08320 [Verrucomicrobia bacterium]|nr:hypothetical protein [Verrucomicrobiota bacterium]